MPVFVGLLMSLAAVTAGLLIAVTYPIGSFPELAFNCAENGLDALSCGNAVLKVGVYSAAAWAAVIIISALMWQYASRWNAKTNTPISPVATKLVVAASMGLVAAHYVAQHYGPAYTWRLDEIARYSSLISLENLLWPLLLQLFVAESESRIRIGILTALAAIMALTPFRAVYMAVVIFGFAVPILGEIARDVRSLGLGTAISRSAKPAALAALVSICALWSGYVDSAARDLGDFQRELEQSVSRAAQKEQLTLAALTSADLQPVLLRIAADQTQAEAVADRPPPRAKNLLQRVLHPLIQAAILEHLAAHMPVPSLMDEIMRKFRLSSRPALNEFLYEKEYHSGQGVAQTTSLYYGEAAAYMPRMMLLWMIAAPLVIVTAWLVLKAKIVDAGTLCGVQLWRSSLAGIVTILPAFIIQVLTLLGMVAFSRLLARSSSLRWLSRASTPVALVAVATLVGVQCWTLVDGRNTILVMGLAPPQGCVFTDWPHIPQRVDALLAEHGLTITSAVWDDDRFADPARRTRPILVEIPQGHAAKGFAGEILDRLAAHVRCADKATAVAPRMITENFFQRKGNLPFELLVVGFGLLTFVLLFREMISARLERNATRRMLTDPAGPLPG